MRDVITIYKKNKLIAKSIVRTKKQEIDFIKKNMPVMTMKRKVSEDWRIFRSQPKVRKYTKKKK